MQLLIGLLVPFAGTAAGALCVFFIRTLHHAAEQILLGFAAGVMTAASVWSLLLPALAAAPDWGALSFLPAAAGFSVGFALMQVINAWLPEPSFAAGGKRRSMLLLAVTLHNIPEGMAVGAAAAGALSGSVAPAAAAALAVGVAVQNVPEGAIISLPLAAGGVKKGEAFALGAASGAVEPVGAAVMLLLAGILHPVFPLCLAFAAGAMLFVVAEQLLPEVGGRASWGTGAFAAGFVLMMALDVALG